MKEFEPNFNKNEKGDKEKQINLEKEGEHLTKEDLELYLAYETTDIVPEGSEEETAEKIKENLDRIRNHLLGPAGTGGCKDCKERLEELRGERS